MAGHKHQIRMLRISAHAKKESTLWGQETQRDTSSVTKIQGDGATLGRFGAGLMYDIGFMLMDRVHSPQGPFTSMKCATENQDGGSPEKLSGEEVLINRLGMLL